MKLNLTRRKLLGAFTGSAVAACAPDSPESYIARSEMVTGAFSHGIASGDPTQTHIIIWTRITPENANSPEIDVTWDMSATEDFTGEVTSGQVKTSAVKNWTVKVDVGDLSPGQSYFYRFRHGDAVSPTGRTQTLPDDGIDRLRFAVVSCANWQHGYFNAYDHIARQDDFDALLHLGDYYYEYGAESYYDHPAGKLGRLHEPRHEIISLDDYRTRHAQYRTDSSLQAASAKMPMIVIWDDHETSNDSWKTGAENHNEGEGDWDARRQAAMRAYYEWMPIRDPKPGRVREDIFRNYEYGDLLTLVTVETRLLARSEPILFENEVDVINADPVAYKRDRLHNPEREMMGSVQMDFVIDALKTSKDAGKPWRLIANQVVMGRVLTTDLAPYIDETAIENIAVDWPGVRDVVGLSKYNLPLYPDSWDGYPAARARFYDALDAAGVHDIFVVTGDSHEFWVNDLTTETGSKRGVEFGTTSVSSETLKKYMGDGTPDYNLLITQSNPDVRYYNALYNGYLDLTFTRNRCDAKLVAVDTVLSHTYSAFEAAAFTVRPEKDSLKVSNPKGLNLKQRALFSGLG